MATDVNFNMFDKETFKSNFESKFGYTLTDEMVEFIRLTIKRNSMIAYADGWEDCKWCVSNTKQTT